MAEAIVYAFKKVIFVHITCMYTYSTHIYVHTYIYIHIYTYRQMDGSIDR